MLTRLIWPCSSQPPGCRRFGSIQLTKTEKSCTLKRPENTLAEFKDLSLEVKSVFLHKEEIVQIIKYLPETFKRLVIATMAML